MDEFYQHGRVLPRYERGVSIVLLNRDLLTILFTRRLGRLIYGVQVCMYVCTYIDTIHMYMHTLCTDSHMVQTPGVRSARRQGVGVKLESHVAFFSPAHPSN